MGIGQIRGGRIMRQSCVVADAETNGRYYCTRELGHEGPCAGVPRFENELTFQQLQEEHREWSTKNFGEYGEDWWKPVFGIVEEAGELCHSLLKQAQGIRGDTETHEAKAKDAIGDMVIFIASVCSARGWDLQDIVEKTWSEVSKRDYSKMKDK